MCDTQLQLQIHNFCTSVDFCVMEDKLCNFTWKWFHSLSVPQAFFTRGTALHAQAPMLITWGVAQAIPLWRDVAV